MYCNKCGNLLSNKDEFCGACGTKVNHTEGKDDSIESENSEHIMKPEVREDSVKFEASENKQVQLNRGLQYVITNKHFMKKIIFLILVIIVFVLSKAEVIEFSVPMTMDDIAQEMWVVREGLHIDITEWLQRIYWTFKIGVWLYLGAAILILLKEEVVGILCTWTGFLCNVFMALQIWSWAENGVNILARFTEAAWGYVIMNIVLFAYANYFTVKPE